MGEETAMPHLKKESLRQAFKERRAAIGLGVQAEASKAICLALLGLERYRTAAGIAVYWPMDLEVDTRPFIDSAMADGRRVYLPRVVKKPRGLHFCRYNGDPETLADGPFGLSEPRTEAADTDDIDLIIVPGLAFDLHGHRLGYGTGYYDRFLKQTAATRIGVAFDVMTIDILPVAEHDVAMNTIVTESRTLSTS